MYNERKDTFSVKDIIVQVLCILLFVFLLLWLFPTKSFIKKNYNGTYSSSDSTVNVEESEQVVDAIFNFNVQTMKEAAISYYTTSRLPAKVGDTDTMSLRKMLSEKLILSFLDSDNKQCDLDNSYVQITKLSDEYTLKVNLVCPASKSDYIIVHLGCYDYCKGNVCEKKTTTTTKTKTYKCKIDGNVYWGSNYTKVTKAEYEKQCKGNTNTNTNTNINVNNNNKTEVNQTNNTTNNTNKNTNNNSNTTNQVNNTTNQTNTATVTNKQEANVNIGGNNTGNITINNDNRTTINQTNTTINNTTINNNTTPTTTPAPSVTVTEYEYRKYIDGSCNWSDWSNWTTTKITENDTTKVDTKVIQEKNGVEEVVKCDTKVFDFVLSSDKKSCTIALGSTVKTTSNTCTSTEKGNYIYNSTYGVCLAEKPNNTSGGLVKGTAGHYETTSTCEVLSVYYSTDEINSLKSSNPGYTYTTTSKQITDTSCGKNCKTIKYQVKRCKNKWISGTEGKCTNSSYQYVNGNCYYKRAPKTSYSCGAIVNNGVDVYGTYNSSTGKCVYTVSPIKDTVQNYTKVTYYRSKTKTCTNGYWTGESVWSTVYNDSSLTSQQYVYTGSSRTVTR